LDNKKEFEKKFWKKVFGTFKKMFIHILGVKKIFGKNFGKVSSKKFGVKGLLKNMEPAALACDPPRVIVIKRN
jgi:hypothetical protein